MNHTHHMKTVTVHQRCAMPSHVFGFTSAISRLNIGLALLALAFLLAYVMQANFLAAQTWRIRQSQDQLASLLEQRNTLIAQQSELDNRAVLQALAIEQGLVPVGTVVYLVQDTSVATVR